MKVGAIDLGSGTIKFSAFESDGNGGWKPLALEEINTELRRGMGPEGLLQAGPVEESLEAVRRFVLRAAERGLPKPPAYGTSALRKARNPELLFGPLEARFGLRPRMLSEDEEGRLNLLGAAPGAQVLVDPGGDSTDCAWGADWRSAATASLPFGSVSLQERFGREVPGQAIPEAALKELIAWVKQALDAFAPAAALKHSGMLPAIRMNAPISRALNLFAGRAPAAESRAYALDELRALTFGMAAMDHEGRAALIAGEPVGKVDRTPFGFASWVALLEWMDAGRFLAEPYGIKLGAALFLSDAWQK